MPNRDNDTTSSGLLNKVIEFHGGPNRWNSYQTLSFNAKMGGLTWSLKGQEGVLSDVYGTVQLHRQSFSWHFVFSERLRSEFAPERVALIGKDNAVVEELQNPRDSFKGHMLTTPWTRLQLIYFSSYATWGYLTAPFHFTMPGIQVKEIEPWTGNNEPWRRLEVHYPDSWAGHSKRQIFYFSPEGFIQRIDYWPEVLGNAPAAHIIEAYGEFNGIKVGTRRRIYSLNEVDNIYQSDPLLISIDIEGLTFE